MSLSLPFCFCHSAFRHIFCKCALSEKKKQFCSVLIKKTFWAKIPSQFSFAHCQIAALKFFAIIMCVTSTDFLIS